jgi:hypothetical protein
MNLHFNTLTPEEKEAQYARHYQLYLESLEQIDYDYDPVVEDMDLFENRTTFEMKEYLRSIKA